MLSASLTLQRYDVVWVNRWVRLCSTLRLFVHVECWFVCPAYEVLDRVIECEGQKSDIEWCRDEAPRKTKLLTCDSNLVICSALFCCLTSSAVCIITQGKGKGIIGRWLPLSNTLWVLNIICCHFLESANILQTYGGVNMCMFTLVSSSVFRWKDTFKHTVLWHEYNGLHTRRVTQNVSMHEINNKNHITW